MKRLKFFVATLMLAAVFCFQASTASAVEKVDFDFYYQSIEDVVQINEPVKEDDSLWEKTKKYAKKGLNWVKKTWEKGVTRNFGLDDGEATWYSDKDSNTAYKVNRTKVTSEAHLLKLMGAKSEKDLSNGQKALLAAYRQAQSDSIKERAEASFLPKVNVILSDTTGFDDPKKYPNVRDDFWPYSSKFTINMQSGYYNHAGGPEQAASTLVHEYAHCMDLTISEFINPYGKDGTHYGNEITDDRIAFIEGWAEYNEMIEFEREAKAKIKNTKSLVIESKDKAGEYTKVHPADCTVEQLRKAESFNALMLYRLATEIDNGKSKVLEAFVDSRWKVFRDLSTFVKQFVKNNPSDAAKVCELVDDVFLGKMTDEELLDMVGKNDATKAYIASRRKAAESASEGIDASSSSSNQNVQASEEVLKLDNGDSSTPF